jgi:hypothetical protein
MKFNWGAGITALYLSFVAGILVLVLMSVNQKIDLVTDQYYEEETKFQEKLNKTKRAKALQEPLQWEVNQEGLTVVYPESGKNIIGKINLYCPSNEQNDRSFDIQNQDNKQFIPAAKIPNGRYRLQIDWKNGTDTYWNEDVIVMGGF